MNDQYRTRLLDIVLTNLQNENERDVMNFGIILKAIRQKMPVLWALLEKLNEQAIIFTLGRSLLDLDKTITESMVNNSVCFSGISPVMYDDCSRFLLGLTEQDRLYFQPFSFDRNKITQVLKSKGFRCYSALKNNTIVGFFFLRLAFNRKAFLGFVVDGTCRGQGIGADMVKAMVHGCDNVGIKLFSSVSQDNIPSMKAHLKNGFVKISEYDNGYWLLKSSSSCILKKHAGNNND